MSNATSCAFKHLITYQRIAEGEDNLALVLEDDIRFYPNFSLLTKIVEEIKVHNIQNFMLSLEDSILKYIPKSESKKINSFTNSNKAV